MNLKAPLTLLRVENFSSRYGDFRVEADFSAASGERVALHAPSGSGKSTLLRWLAGFTSESVRQAATSEVTTGSLFLDGTEITQYVPEKRRFGMVFQDYALFPHWTVLQNVAFGLEVRGMERDQRETAARGWLEKLGMATRATTLAGVLSGGEKQRVALARAMIWEPTALLFDEPFAALDLATRKKARDLVLEIVTAAGIPMIFVTHDVEDVRILATRTLSYSRSADGNRHSFGDPREFPFDQCGESPLKSN